MNTISIVMYALTIIKVDAGYLYSRAQCGIKLITYVSTPPVTLDISISISSLEFRSLL